MIRVRALAGTTLCAYSALALLQAGRATTDEGTASGGRGFLAVRAGTVHLVEEGRVLHDGTVLIKDGRIQAVGDDVPVPIDAEVVDYGADAVIVPGLVAAYSSYAQRMPTARTAEPALSALDGFDPYRVYGDALSGGVTSAYIVAAEGRLIAGTGAVVKLGGPRDAERVLNPLASLHGAVDASARSTPGYWEPPVPVAVDVELGYARPQLPRTISGAILALGELLDFAARPGDSRLRSEYGPSTGADLSRLLEAGVPLRLSAVEEPEIRALLAFAGEHHLRLILDRADRAGALAAEIAAADVPVVFRLPYWPNSPATDQGKGPDDRWRQLDVPAQLVGAGARVAITGPAPHDLLFAARLASRGGLDPAAALRAVTLAPAQILGVDERVGSLRPGKDADLCVLNGDPLAPASSVLATWIGGQVVWKAHEEERATVLEVQELHVGDGSVLRPGQLLMQGERIVEVGERVSHPPGAVVVRGRACMPGMIDALGHLGLAGSRKVPGTDFAMATIVESGDEVDRKVALQGITTVVLGPRGASGSGAPLMAYKPAAARFEHQVVQDPAALRVRWDDSNPIKSGEDVRNLLAKAKDYRDKWIEYEQALAAWTPPPEEPAAATQADEKAEKKDEGAEEDKKAEEEKDEKKDDSKPKKKKKDEPKELEPDPITGVWAAEVKADGAASTLKLRLHLAEAGVSAAVEGNLRCDAASSTLVEVEGWFDREQRSLEISGLGSRGWVRLNAQVEEGVLAGKLSVAGQELEARLERGSKEYVVARRPERPSTKEEPRKEPKGKPKEPKLDPKLEPLRRAIEGRGALVIDVHRRIDILACVEACAAVGIRPILYGAEEAHQVAEQLAGRVAGVLLSPRVVESDPKRGTRYLTPYSLLQNAGVRVAFLSEAEEGAIDLPLRAAYAVANGLSPEGALRALTADAAGMLAIDGRVGRLAGGLDADVLLLDGPPLDASTSVLRTWVNGEEIEAP